jgi:hypothetical protein
MATAVELIEYLQTLPPETEIQVLERYSNAFSTDTRWEPLEIAEHSDTLFLCEGILYLGED